MLTQDNLRQGFPCRTPRGSLRPAKWQSLWRGSEFTFLSDHKRPLWYSDTMWYMLIPFHTFAPFASAWVSQFRVVSSHAMAAMARALYHFFNAIHGWEPWAGDGFSQVSLRCRIFLCTMCLAKETKTCATWQTGMFLSDSIGLIGLKCVQYRSMYILMYAVFASKPVLLVVAEVRGGPQRRWVMMDDCKICARSCRMPKLRQTCSMSQLWKLGAKRCTESQCFHDKSKSS